jgi:hypothetical protein
MNNKADRLQLEWQSREANKEARQAEMERRTREHQLKVQRYKKYREIKKTAGPDALILHAIGRFVVRISAGWQYSDSFFQLCYRCRLAARGERKS